MPEPEMPVETPPQITNKILAHYDACARDLPWRSLPGQPAMDAYRVWLSEIMLQQTTVASVKAYYEKFTRRWPKVADLAAADDAEVMAAWAGLGYYARARNLLACARDVAGPLGGHFPDTEAGLRALPGIGPYTAAAIAAIAFGRPSVVVDGNVERVISRLYAVTTPLPAAKAQIHALVAPLVPADRPGDFAQAMMDLGATICTPRKPLCALCPVHSDCQGRLSAEDFPVKPPKRAKPSRQGQAWWIEVDGHVFLVRRPAKGLLGGMRALPSCDWRGLAGAPPCPGKWENRGEVDHVFTHFRLTLAVQAIQLGARPDLPLAGEWWPIDRLAEAGLPTLFDKAAKAAQKGKRIL
ncbi:MAG: A/G-specific adenine glycosylase [Chakrabartia sp.]